MSFNDKEAAQELQLSAEVYILTVAGTISRMTSYETDLTIDGNVYTSKPLRRSGFTIESQGVSKVIIEAPVVEPFSKFIANTPFQPVFVTIRKYYLDDLGTYRPLFNGLIRNVSVKNNLANAECVSIEHFLKRRIPRVLYQSFCNHTIFDPYCGLVEANYAVSAVVTVSGSTISSATFDGYADGYFIGGYVTFNNDIRLVTNHVGAVLTLHVPFSDLDNGETVVAYPGCNGNPATCLNTFNNLANFLGMDYIPAKSPVLWTLR